MFDEYALILIFPPRVRMIFLRSSSIFVSIAFRPNRDFRFLWAERIFPPVFSLRLRS